MTANSSRSLTAILEWRRRGDFFASGSSLLLPRKAFKSEAGPANERVPYQNIIYVLCRSSLRTRKGPRDVGNIFFSLLFFKLNLSDKIPASRHPPNHPPRKRRMHNISCFDSLTQHAERRYQRRDSNSLSLSRLRNLPWEDIP